MVASEVARVHGSPSGSPKAEVGEIDTSAPFRSVKAAVSLFGEVSSPRDKPLSKIPKSSTERVLDKETQLHLAEKKLHRLKEQLKDAQNTKDQAHFDLEKAKRTLHDLNCRLKTVTDSKKSAIEATEAAKIRAKRLEEACSQEQRPGDWRVELDQERERYRTASNELAIVKQELRKIQQDFDSFLEAKIVAFQQAADAQHALKANREKVSELSKDISGMQDSLNHVRRATQRAKEEQSRATLDRDVQERTHEVALEGARKNLLSLNREFDPELTRDLGGKLTKTTAEIEVLQEKIKTARTTCLDTARILSCELDDGVKALRNVREEECLLRSSVDSLKLELENAKSDHLKLEKEEAETELVTGNLSMEVERSKSQLETVLADERGAVEAFAEMSSTIQRLSSESKCAAQEAEEAKKVIEELRQEADHSSISNKEAETKLEAVLRKAQEARAAEKTVLDMMRMKISCANTNNDSAVDSNASAKINMPMAQFESLTRKVEECHSLAEEKVATSMAEVESIKQREDEALRKLETGLREMEEVEAETKEILRKAEMAEAAKKAVESELKRWRQEEEGKASYPVSEIRGIPEILL